MASQLDAVLQCRMSSGTQTPFMKRNTKVTEQVLLPFLPTGSFRKTVAHRDDCLILRQLAYGASNAPCIHRSIGRGTEESTGPGGEAISCENPTASRHIHCTPMSINLEIALALGAIPSELSLTHSRLTESSNAALLVMTWLRPYRILQVQYGMKS